MHAWTHACCHCRYADLLEGAATVSSRLLQGEHFSQGAADDATGPRVAIAAQPGALPHAEVCSIPLRTFSAVVLVCTKRKIVELHMVFNRSHRIG